MRDSIGQYPWERMPACLARHTTRRRSAHSWWGDIAPWAHVLSALRFVFGVGLLLAAMSPGDAQETTTAPARLLVETEWLARHLAQPTLRIVDVRPGHAYHQGHIPQAVHLDPEMLVDAQHIEHGRRGSPEVLALLLGRLGIGHGTSVVAYDHQDGLYATRLWWVLTASGHHAVSVLHGGWGKWQREQRPVTTAVWQPPLTTFTVHPPDGSVATRAQVRKAMETSAVTIVDTRSWFEYRGWRRYAARGGHIPGAVHVEWTRTLQRDGTFLPPERLKALLLQAGVAPDKPVITYCQVGVRAAHLAFVLTLLGYPQVAVYDGSWAEWGNDPYSPIE